MSNETNNKLMYEFDIVNSGVMEGINDAVITTFDTHIPTTIAREAIQNILDARKTKPVIAEFSLDKWKVADIPDAQELKAIFKSCLDFWPKDIDCTVNFESALKTLEQKHIQVLTISDYNTNGLAGGDNDTFDDYFNFLKSQGSSSKDSTGAGSFGLGKGSFYAASKLKMIFVSSIYDGNKFVFQGKLRLVSHKDDRGLTKRGTGSYGFWGEKPVRDKNLIPGQFRRSKQGTSIFVPGFKGSEHWEKEMIASVLNSFWYAIHKGDLEVRIQDKKINSRNLDHCINEYFDINNSTGPSDTNPLPYYEAYTDIEHHKAYEAELETLGKVQLYLSPQEGFPKKVACFRRNKMLIQTKAFRSPVGYAGVFICENTKGNEILRKMEPPNHNEWSVNNTHSKLDGLPLKEAEKASQELLQFIREKVKELSDISSEAQLAIPGISKYLYLPGDEDVKAGTLDSPDDEGEVVQNETAIQQGVSGRKELEVSARDKAAVIRFRTTGQVGPGDLTGVGVGFNPGGGKKKRKDDDGIPTGEGGTGKAGGGEDELKQLNGVNFRAFAKTNKKNGYDHVVILRGNPNTKCRVKIFAGTDDGFDELEIKSAKDEKNKTLSIQKGMITKVKMNRSGTALLTLNFNDHEKYSLRAMAYEDK